MEPVFPYYVGACIYCGTTSEPLSDEHVIPFGLNGQWRLLEASCATHRDVTSSFEGAVQRGAFMVPRASMSLRTRHKRNRPATLPVTVTRAGARVVEELPVEQHPAFFAFPIFEDPGLPSGNAQSGIGIRTFVLASHLELASRFRATAKAESFGAPFPDLVAFARMLTKIGYCFAVSCVGYEAVADSPVVPAILGTDPRVGLWVGNIARPPRAGRTGFHEVVLVGSDAQMLAHVRLFAQIGAPEYVVQLR